MISGLKPKQLLYRDGTGQGQRLMEALNPGYVRIDERTTEDLIGFAQAYAKELIFFDNDNNPVGNWEAFLIDDIDGYNGKTADEKTIHRKKWIADIVQYVDDPDKFAGDPEKFRRLSRPHLALFISFLQLLGHIRNQLNGLTGKHLNFYYYEALGLSKKRPLPDVVHVIVDLANDIDDFFLEKGTLLFAGKDSLGEDLIYKTDKDVEISKAQVGNIKTVFIEKNISGIRQAHRNNRDDEDEGFTKMTELALGDPDPADKLPAFPDKAKNLLEVYKNLTIADKRVNAQAYVEKQLFLPLKEFNFVLSLHKDNNAKGYVPTEEDWEKAYAILDKAYKEKIKWKRRQALKKMKESETDSYTGFIKMIEYALGDPNPGDKLPIYNGNAINVYTLYDDLKSKDTALKNEALEYIREDLLLTEKEFITSIKTVRKSDATAAEWDLVYDAFEKAQRKKRDYELPVPLKEDWVNIYAVQDARASAFSLDGEEGQSSLRFKTFGDNRSGTDVVHAQPANIGFALSSPQLALNEGNRTVTLTISFKKNDAIRVDQIIKALAPSAADQQPFLFFLSSEKEWLQPKLAGAQWGSFAVTGSAEEYVAKIDKNVITKSKGSPFNDLDKGRFIIWDDGSIYLIQSVQNDTSVLVVLSGKLPAHKGIKKYNQQDVYFNALQVQLQLSENDPPVTAPQVPNEVIGIRSAFPVLGMVLNQIPVTRDGQGQYINKYQVFKDLQIEKIKAGVQVANIKEIVLQSDDSMISYKKPFEPFGFLPETGDSLYFAHPELSGKRLDELTLRLEWLKPPKDFKAYYENYWKIVKSDKSVTGVNEIADNTDFKAELSLIDNNTAVSLGTINLFVKDNAQLANDIVINVAGTIASKYPSYQYGRDLIPESPDEEVLNWERYFRLELGAMDFQHNLYPSLVTKQAVSDPAAGVKTLTLNSPYTPKLKSVVAGYSASFELNLTAGLAHPEDSIYHVQPFGYNKLEITGQKTTLKNTWFLPYFTNEGELYLGLSQLKVPQNLSILFQMAEGSADPDLEPPQIQWSYLGNNKWWPLEQSKIVSDFTNGLINTGITIFNLPVEMVPGNTLLNDGLYWLKAGVETNSAAISDTVDVLTQGISATFEINDNADEHLLNLLPAESINETVNDIPEVARLKQPFTSSKGKPAEVDRLFYNRVSERLRHKNRAITMWDYERIVLEQFPQIYKAKCIPAEFSGNPADSGKIDLIVIPDIKGKLPFNPFQPKVPANVIYEIQVYLEERMPAYASLKVKNPAYLQVKTRFAVKLKFGYNEGLFRKKLEEELKRYLAPWAYDEGADLILGGKIYANVIVNFIAERPYVDYVARIKLFQSEDGIQFTDVRTLNNGENLIQATRPDVILVSALHHEIDIITEKGFEEEDFTGINYMRIELDFTVGADLVV